MRILKIKGSDEKKLMEQIKKEYGESVFVINSQEERRKGTFGFLRKKTYVVTIAIEENEEITPKSHNDIGDSSINTNRFLNEVTEQLEELRRDIYTVKQNTVPISQEKITQGMAEKLENLLLEEGLEKGVTKKLFKDCYEITDRARLTAVIQEKLKQEIVTDSESLPKIVFFAGSTGVGKTTTIAKLTAKKVLEEKKKVVLFTADTYRIAAIEQLRTYADILGVPLEVIYQPEDMKVALEKWQDVDHIFIDTAGRSHKNITELEEMKKIIDVVQEKKVFLVLNINTAYGDAKNIIDIYKQIIGRFQMILTKIDETDALGNLVNIALYSQTPIAYITNGQSVPDDIESFEYEGYIKQLLGRISYE